MSVASVVAAGSLAAAVWRCRRLMASQRPNVVLAFGSYASVGPVLAAILPETWQRAYMANLAPPAELTPQAAQQRLNNVIVRVLQAAAQLRPTLIVIEGRVIGRMVLGVKTADYMQQLIDN